MSTASRKRIPKRKTPKPARGSHKRSGHINPIFYAGVGILATLLIAATVLTTQSN